MIFPLTVLFSIAVFNAVENGLGADGEVIEGLRTHKTNRWLARITFLIPSQLLIFIHPQKHAVVPLAISSPSSSAHSPPKPDPSPVHPPPPPPPSNSGAQPLPAPSSRCSARRPLVPFLGALSKVTTFGDTVEAGTAGLTTKLGWATYVQYGYGEFAA
jgi:hypothetical protein